MPGWDELEVGTENAPRTEPPLTIQNFVQYQGASGDLNPIHYDTAFAQAAGYPGPFAVGMHQAGRMATYVTDWLGPRMYRPTLEAVLRGALGPWTPDVHYITNSRYPTHGGFLSEGYIHGMSTITEAVRQLRGTSCNQVAGAEVALVGASFGSAMIVGR